MKALYLLVGLTASYAAQAQSSWYDSFSDSSLHQNPQWTGDTAAFSHTSNGVLRLSDSAGGTSSIYTISDISQHGHWSGWLALDFNPSTSNYADIILCESPTGEAYRLRVGGNAQDRIELLHVKPGIETVLSASIPGLLGNTSINLGWSVERHKDSAWVVEVNLDSLGWQTIIQIPDSSVFASAQFGIECHYTKTRADKFYFDDISVVGEPFVDTIPPALIAYEWIDRKSVRLKLSESCYADSGLVVDQFGVNWQLLFTSNREVTLYRDLAADDGTYHINLNTIKDLEGNPIGAHDFELERHPRGSLQVTEIMSDVDPPVEIEREYIELQNRTSGPLNLQGWSIFINQNQIELPDTNLLPNGYLVISDGPLEGAINTNRASFLNRTSGIIKVKDDWAETIDFVQYENSWHSTNWKAGGGWSLEKDVANSSCSEPLKWSSSRSSSGGTPGRANLPEGSRKEILNEIQSIQFHADSLHIIFDLRVETVSLHSNIDTLIGAPIDFNRRTWRFTWPEDGRWELSAEDCLGRELDTSFITIEALDSAVPQVWVTEICPNTMTDRPDFIEIENRGQTAFRLGDLRFGKWDAKTGIEQLYLLEPKNQIVLPNEVIVMAEYHSKSMFAEYPKANTRSVLSSEMPFSPSSSGGVCITTKDGKLIDAVAWSNDDYGDLEEREGKTLTRKSNGKWSISAARYNFGTPGWHEQNTSAESGLKFDNLAFYTNDEIHPLKIHIPEEWSGSRLTITLRNKAGIELGKLHNSMVVIGFETIVWFGVLNGETLPTGQYLIELIVEDKDGYREVYHQGCLLIQK
ncbi:lamin tail domain-containing protein [Phaeocystidibacter luteus]|uniref:Lamin tail domain-containing protein n=1 Tax=Phaeocystidibacter luteus TaxID=911197 RepID=A0A6N6RJJ0_9FLAO|nr:lamin tail domain-containing protein [Phaeocystidibacter luteus]KAB2813893.1 lamin tail domain-containing protein [Phaeocystidibacter luteus]